MVVHVLTQIIGMFSCLVSAWLMSSVFDAIGNDKKVDKFILFWGICTLVIGAFLIITG